MSSQRPEPGAGFAGLGLDRSILHAIERAGFVSPRPIQKQTIPAVLAGRDVLGLAQTGTGKTAAFAIPLLQGLSQRRGAGSRALIVAPTRELASQIADETRRLAGRARVRVVTVFGGVSDRAQISALRKRPEVIVACPGRLLDLYRRGEVQLDRIETLILDEADHMFDMGFLPDIRQIIAALPESRQNLLFSATMPKQIRALAEKVLSRPHVVDLTRGASLQTIEHAIYHVDDAQKREALEVLLSEPDFRSGIVFTRTRHRTRRLARQLGNAGRKAVALEGDMSQNARDRAMRDFREGRVEILVATDIAARGIDVAGVSHVINFDMPGTPDAYTHRIGRTGRSEREGKAYTLVTRTDLALVRKVESLLGSEIPSRTVSLGAPSARPGKPAGRASDPRRSRSRRSRGRRPRKAATRS